MGKKNETESSTYERKGLRKGHLREKVNLTGCFPMKNGRRWCFPMGNRWRDCRKLGAATMAGEALFSLFFAFDECEVKGKGRGFLVLEGFGRENNDYPARDPIKVERDTRKTSAESSFQLIRATKGSFTFNMKTTLPPTWREGVQRMNRGPLKLCTLPMRNSSGRAGEQLEWVKSDYPTIRHSTCLMTSPQEGE